MIPEKGLKVQVRGTSKTGIIINMDSRRDFRLGTNSKILFVQVQFPDNSVTEYEVHDLRKSD